MQESAAGTVKEEAPPAATERRGAAGVDGAADVDAGDARLTAGFETDNDIDDDGNPAFARARPQAT